MEVVEEANRALVKSCIEFLDIMSLPRDEVQSRNVMEKASDVLLKAKRFSSVVSNGRGHARFRQSTSVLSDNPFLGIDDPAKSVFKSNSSHENLLESSGLNQGSANTSLFPETHLLQPIGFHQNPNAELGSSSKHPVCLDLSSNEKPKPKPSIFHHNLNEEPGLNSNGKAKPGMLLNAEPSSSSKSLVWLDLSSNGKPHSGIFHHNLSAEPGSSSKSSMCLDLSSNPKPPLHRSLHAPKLLQFQQQKLQHQQQMKEHTEMLFHRGTGLNFDYNPTMSSTRSLMSSLSVDGSVSNMSGPFMADPRSGNGSVHCGSSGSRCHRRTNEFRRSIIVPAISNKIANIPPDEYTWKKYGQKPIKNADHPRAYYKCSSKDCQARKQVERCTDDPTKLRITYRDDHDHPP